MKIRTTISDTMNQTTTHEQLWEKARQFIADNISQQQFAAWFGSVTSLSFENGELRLSLPSSYYAEQLEERFLPLLEAAIKKVYGPGVALIYCYNTIKDIPESAVQVRSSEQSFFSDSRTAVANPFAPANPTVNFDSQLNPRYNFKNYCVGDTNRLAHSIAMQLAGTPSNKTFNPFFLFGPTGVGKTHLIQAIGIGIKEKNPKARVLYVTARLFQSQYTAANHKGQINNFFHFYQSIDTLIVDDVQDLAGKPETQNTFFQIFNQLHLNNRQVILSSDCPPSEMDGFEPRLLGRFKWGVSVALEKPDMDLRRRVLIKKAEQDGLCLQPDVIEYIAENVTDSIRELEGVVVSLVAHATALNREINLDLARIVVGNAIRMRRRQVNFEMVTEAVASYFDMSSDMLFTKTRKREVSDARQIIMYLAKKMADMSLKSIGTRLGRTHATILYGCRNIEERLPYDRTLREAVEAIQSSIVGG